MKARHDRRALLRWAIAYIEDSNESLASCHRNPFTKQIQPASVRREVAECRKWVRKAKAAVA